MRQFIAVSAVILCFFALVPLSASQTLPRREPVQDSTELVTFIKEQQKLKVKESTAPDALHCFTDVDLQAFHDADTVGAIRKALTSDTRFSKIVAKLKSLPADRRHQVVETAKKTFKPTWGVLGRIDRAGQTDAGQTAEREIAEAIAAEVAREIR